MMTGKIAARHYQTGQTFLFTFRKGRLVSRLAGKAKTDLLFGPGFCDLQCNGFAGVDFNDPEAAPEAICAAIRALWAYGCTSVLPTVITHTPERIEHLLAALRHAAASDPEVARSVPGFHLEGPFISPEDGARGAHPLKAVTPVRRRAWDAWQRAAGGAIRMVTVAPEVKGALAFIEELHHEGVIPALGHTLATAEQFAQAAVAGARLSTHLGNGVPQLLHRHRNPILAQAAEDRLCAALIADGIHLPPEMVRLLWRAKQGRVLLVTDAMAAAGAPPGRYRLADLELEVGENRIVRQPGGAYFAGSALTMNCAVANLQAMAGIRRDEAWNAASVEPWAMLRSATPAAAPAGSFIIADPGESTLEILLAVRGRRILWNKIS